MPIYEYRCDRCGHKMEEMRSISERNHLEDCGRCEKGYMQRVLSPTPTTFKHADRSAIKR